MPAPADLLGRRFGRLVVLDEGPRTGSARTWLVRCDCGAEEIYPQRRLTGRTRRVEACSTCRARPCTICGGPIMGARRSRTCSADCQQARERQHQRAHYHRHADRIAERRRERPPPPGDHAAKWAAQRAREAADPAVGRKRRATNRAHYDRHAELIQERQRKRRAALTDDQREAEAARKRRYDREYQARRRGERALREAMERLNERDDKES